MSACNTDWTLAHTLDVLIRARFLLGMALLCYRILAPLLSIAIWALILAVPSTLCTCASRPNSATAGAGPDPAGSARDRPARRAHRDVHELAGQLCRTLIEAVQYDTFRRSRRRQRRSRPCPSLAGSSTPSEPSRTAICPAFVRSMQPKIWRSRSHGARLHRQHRRRPARLARRPHPSRHIHAFGEHGARACLSVFERLAGESRGPASPGSPLRPSVPSHRAWWVWH